ncbi:MAG TPA: hypothetical protein VGJ59_22040 [Jatrophihabitantaceae bacterium]
MARAARRHGLALVEVERLAGTTAVIDWLAGIAARLGVKTVAVDPRSPSATLVDPMRKARLPVRTVDMHQLATAHGLLLDALTAGTVQVRGSGADLAARVAAERRLSGARAIDRYTGEPAAVLAIELAHWALLVGPRFPPPQIFGGDDFGYANPSLENPNVPLG